MTDAEMSLRPRQGETPEQTVDRVILAARKKSRAVFTIEVFLGEGMRSSSDVLHAIGRALSPQNPEGLSLFAPLETGLSGLIRDAEDNATGTWVVN